MKIRPAHDSHAEVAARLWTEGYTGVAPGGRSVPYAPAEFLEAAREGRPFLAVEEEGTAGEAVDHQRTAGIVVFYPPGAGGRAVPLEGEAELSRLVVAVGSRGRGVGCALVNHCTQLALVAGATGIVLWSRPYQTAAHRLYEAAGYRRVPERDHEDADGSCLVFRLALRPR